MADAQAIVRGVRELLEQRSLKCCLPDFVAPLAYGDQIVERVSGDVVSTERPERYQVVNVQLGALLTLPAISARVPVSEPDFISNDRPIGPVLLDPAATVVLGEPRVHPTVGVQASPSAELSSKGAFAGHLKWAIALLAHLGDRRNFWAPTGAPLHGRRLLSPLLFGDDSPHAPGWPASERAESLSLRRVRVFGAARRRGEQRPTRLAWHQITDFQSGRRADPRDASIRASRRMVGIDGSDPCSVAIEQCAAHRTGPRHSRTVSRRLVLAGFALTAPGAERASLLQVAARSTRLLSGGYTPHSQPPTAVGSARGVTSIAGHSCVNYITSMGSYCG